MLTATSMAYVTLSGQFETASGSWRKPKKVNGHNHGNYVISQHRVAATTNPHCNRAYAPLGDVYTRSTQPSAKELAIRERFTEVRAMVAARRKNLNQISQDQLDFIAQKDTATGKKTMTAYLWMVCGEEYDAAHQG